MDAKTIPWGTVALVTVAGAGVLLAVRHERRQRETIKALRLKLHFRSGALTLSEQRGSKFSRELRQTEEALEACRAAHARRSKAEQTR